MRRFRIASSWLSACLAAGLLAFAASPAEAAAAPSQPRTLEIDILANGQLVLSGQLIDGMDELEATLRVMREQEPPLELRLRLPKTFGFETIAAIAQIVQRMGMSLGFILDGEPPGPAPIDSEGDTI